MKRLAIVVCAIDGLVTMQSGVGVVVANFVRAFPGIASVLEGWDYAASLFCISPVLSPSGEYFDKRVGDQTLESCLKTSGNLVFTDSLASGGSWREFYAVPPGQDPLPQWKAIGSGMAAEVNRICFGYDATVVLCHDGACASVCLELAANARVNCIWIPHGLASQLPNDTAGWRLNFEKEVITSLVLRDQLVGYVGSSFALTLIGKYNVPKALLTPFLNRLDLFDPRYKERALPAFDRPVPIDAKRIILFVGRCHRQKGVDFLVEALQRFFETRESEKYVSLLILPDSSSNDGFAETIMPQIAALGDNVEVCWNFSASLVKEVLASSALDVIVMPSRYEAMSMFALEAIAFTRGNVKFVLSDIPCFREIFNDCSTAFWMSSIDGDGLLDGLTRAISFQGTRDTSVNVESIVAGYASDLSAAMEHFYKLTIQ